MSRIACVGLIANSPAFQTRKKSSLSKARFFWHSMDVRYSRRQFLKIFAVGAATSAWGPKRWVQTYAAEVQPAPAPKPAVFKVTFTQYPVLQNEFSSVRLSVNPMLGDFPYGRFYPILVNRGEGTQFYAMSSECTHAGCVVPPFMEFDGGIVCPCHQSAYAIDGHFLGRPDCEEPCNQADLRRYAISYDRNETLTVEVPEMGFSVAGGVVADGARFQLDFQSFEWVDYEVQFRPGFGAGTDWQVTSFSLTPDGPADQQVFTGNGNPASLFVDRTTPAGFYAVSMRMMEI